MRVISGLNGVIRKTVNEDLAENIWDPRCVTEEQIIICVFINTKLYIY